MAARVECTPDRIHFDFDSHSIRSDARNILEDNARCFKQMGNPQVTVEGHCDERGTEEYNLALGERRANSVRQYLERLGVSNVRTLSYGENRPLERGRNESSYSRNRRAEFQVNR